VYVWCCYGPFFLYEWCYTALHCTVHSNQVEQIVLFRIQTYFVNHAEKFIIDALLNFKQ